jgi:hypothetical protein
VLKGNHARVVDLGRERRFENVAGVEPGQLLAFAFVVEGADEGERLQRSAEAPLGFLGGA